MARLKQSLTELYPAFQTLSPALLDDVLRNGVVRSVAAGSVMFDEHNPCQAFPMLLEGVIRVIKVGANGRELQLYRVVPGESCILSTSCMLGTTAYTARGARWARAVQASVQGARRTAVTDGPIKAS